MLRLQPSDHARRNLAGAGWAVAEAGIADAVAALLTRAYQGPGRFRAGQQGWGRERAARGGSIEILCACHRWYGLWRARLL